MEIWKKNLIVCWVGMFFSGIGLSQIAPVMPLYIQHLGITNTALVSQFSGVAFGITFIVSAIFSPIWGMAADKFGRKSMLLRASLGMAIIIGCMGFAQNVYVLIGLRLLQGVISGYGTACTTLIATQADKEHAGWALGVLSTSNIAGSLLGPIIGGFIEENFGLQNVFFITGGLMLVAFAATSLFVKENFVRQDKKAMGMKELWGEIPNKSLTLILFVTSFAVTIALYSVEPIVTLYVTQISRNTSHIALMSGVAFSASGLASIIAAPYLGRLSDRVGAQKVILPAILAAGLVFIPQAFVNNPWQLVALRFLLGLAIAGLNPSINTLVKKITPDSLTGRVFGLNISAQYLGVFSGSILGGQVAAYLGIKYVFFITSAILLINGAWVYFNVYRKLRGSMNEGKLV